jgi:hypothetical protein
LGLRRVDLAAENVPESRNPIQAEGSRAKPFNLWLGAMAGKMMSGLDAVWGSSAKRNGLRSITQGKIIISKIRNVSLVGH